MEKLLEMLPFLIPLAVLQLGLLGYALYHALTHKRYRVGSRLIWVPLILLVNFIGPILYLVVGKEDV
jgi:hypothetical protein